MTMRLFCGELTGTLIGSLIATTASEVRLHVAVMFQPGAPVKVGWAEAKKEGWRVVPVNVERAR